MAAVNSIIENIRPYRVASHKVWMVSPEERSKVLKLDWNESTVGPAPEVREALKALMEEDDFFHLYPSTYNEELMFALCAYTGMTQENIQYFGSSDSLHEYICRAYLEKGDKVLVLWPSYDNFRVTAESTGAVLSYSEMSSDFVCDFGKLFTDLRAVQPKLAYICNPNNPTGTLLSPRDIEELLKAFPDTIFLIDEAYEEFSASSVMAFVNSYENLLVTRTLSKAFGLANLRFGYLVASESNIEAVSRIRNPKNITTFTQVAATEALRHQDHMWAYVEEVKAARSFFIEALNGQPYADRYEAFPSEGNFVLIRCRDAMVKAATLQFLEQNNIFIRNVSQAESLANCVRITIGTREQMQRVLDVLGLAIEWKIV